MGTTNYLNKLEGVWESVSLNPAVMIFRHYCGDYRLVVMHMETHSRQTRPAVYDIESGDNGLYIGILSLGGQRVEFDPLTDTLTLSRYGDYMRN